MLWDFDLFRPRSVRIVPRLVRYASPGDIIVIHDGDHVNPRADRQHAIDVTRRLIPALRQKGFSFGRICTGLADIPGSDAARELTTARPKLHRYATSSMSRPWTAFYHPQTRRTCRRCGGHTCPRSSPKPIGTYRDNPAFTLFLPNGTQGTISYGEVDQLSDAFAVYLREVAGLAAGDRVALLMPNCLAYPIAVFGCLKAGLVMVNTNPLYTVPEMVHQFNDSGAVGLVAIDVFATKVAEVAAEDVDQARWCSSASPTSCRR